MAGEPTVAELLKKLEERHDAYWQSLREVHEALIQTAGTRGAVPTSGTSSVGGVLAASGAESTLSRKGRRRSTRETAVERPAEWLAKAERPKDGSGRPQTLGSSVITGESEDSDIEEEYYVQRPLPAYTFDHEDLRQHLKTYKFNGCGEKLLETVVENGRLLDPTLFKDYPIDELWHNSHYSVFDVGKDGAPLSRSEIVEKGSKIDSAIWQAIQNLNPPESQRRTVGRITIVREPSPIILGALHMTMNEHFDMDELFEYLVNEDVSHAYALDRNFSHDQRRQRSFVFKFDYFTIVEDDIQPMPWQQSDTAEKLSKRPADHIPISRCSSVIALSLSGDPIKRLRNNTRKARKEHTDHGNVYDPWGPWHVINIQCYPDHKHSMEVHDSTKHYVNGPEAFLHTLLAEFQDAEKRFSHLFKNITKLIIPPSELMFNGELRDKLLFEDEHFTYSRRYFWGYQTLGVMRDGIRAIMDSYQKTFKEDVWEGKHRTLWPMLDEKSSRNVHWKERMVKLKNSFEKSMTDLDNLYEEIDERRKEIRTLRDQLFSGTSVLESRKSVELSEVTILQGHNIKLLTLVSIFFLPLTFVTSVFGMTDMPAKHFFTWFGVTMATVNVPFFLLIGSLNTTSGMEFWRGKWYDFLHWIQRLFSKVAPDDESSTKSEDLSTSRRRSLSMSEPSRDRRRSDTKPRLNSTASKTLSQKARAGPNLSIGSETSSGGGSRLQNPRQPDGEIAPVAETSEGESTSSTAAKKVPRTLTPMVYTENGTVSDISWWDKLTGSRKKRSEHNV